jgi:hypothetical protein
MKKSKLPKPAVKIPEIAESMKSATALWGIPAAVLRSAKASGCGAFKGARVFRTPLLEWLKANQAVAGEAVKIDIAKANRGELEVEKLRAQTAMFILRTQMLDRTLILRTEATAEWSRAVSILEQEYRAFLEPAHFAVAQNRAKLRIGNLLSDDMPVQQSDPAGVY